MTSVILRRVENRLERMVRPRGGGVRAADALEAAVENLKSIEDVCVQELDARLVPVLAFAHRDPALRPSDAEMADLIHHADRALTACGALNLPLLGKTLVLLSAMADALSHTRYWPDGALTPAINLVAVFRHGSVPDADGEALLEQLHLCLTQYVRHADTG
ncbi:MAG: hypothetical protein KJ676_05510 [Alphaproteobacteria bacterium]|nr:hypothetical protein [Alphaproteobacteria bacterium]MBU1525204.1 hypothetical protein [Alphaproteobacteria bacterium]MBU2117767.1 hypothetical protein [Alphaproteobacteria bacterium]MBU2352200.1 hypothetical protein [Alphaproteobacteria bacterium]MBU2381210.1 hypothetical protein [Alphaproteobacteria bacterium]